jgi:hypothetical protein
MRVQSHRQRIRPQVAVPVCAKLTNAAKSLAVCAAFRAFDGFARCEQATTDSFGYSAHPIGNVWIADALCWHGGSTWLRSGGARQACRQPARSRIGRPRYPYETGSRSDRQFSGIRSRQRGTTGTVKAGRRPRSGFALGQGHGGLSLGLQRLIWSNRRRPR